LQGGEALLSLVGTIGRTAVVPPDLASANIARALAVIPVRETVDPRYVAIALSCDRVTRELTDLSHEVARKTLNLEDVRRYEIPLPSHAEQLEIVKAVETVETWITSIEEVVAQTLRRADHLRSSILAAAFSGRLVPQDPRDEPATVLLERIEAERTRSNGYKPTRTRKLSAPQETGHR
jgi:type I restriction enzyme S subunit